MQNLLEGDALRFNCLPR